MPDIKGKFPNALAAFMKREKIGSTKLAGLIGNSKQNITRWANQSRALPPEMADKIAPILKTTAAKLLLVDTPTSYVERSMPDPDLNLIMERLLAIQADMREIRTDITGMHATLEALGDGQTVLGNMFLRIERDMVQVKRLLGQMDARLVHLEAKAVL